MMKEDINRNWARSEESVGVRGEGEVLERERWK